MNRRGFLRLLGLAPAMAVAGAVPAARHVYTVNVDANGNPISETVVRRIIWDALEADRQHRKRAFGPDE